MNHALRSRAGPKATPVLVRASLANPPGRLTPSMSGAHGSPLAEGERALMEARFGHDFAAVRIHADNGAGRGAAAIGVKAYTLGDDIVLGPGLASADGATRRSVLAHELAHVVQQSGHSTAGSVGLSDARQEREAQQAAIEVLAGRPAPCLSRDGRRALAPFSDTAHHIIEEAALPGAGFTRKQMQAIEHGNVQRDYSQLSPLGNVLLLGKLHSFGGYDPAEHFDNFIYDTVTQRWRTRGAGPNKFLHLDPAQPDDSPIDYVTRQLINFARRGSNPQSLESLGNAFHTVEDFFAHSNFMELTQGNQSFGPDLLTGSFGPADADASLVHTLGAVSPQYMQRYDDSVAEGATARTEPMSHSRMAKDTPSAPGFTEARRLAALVIQDLGARVIVAMRSPKPEARVTAMKAMVIAKIRRYLRPPDPKDRWWETLSAGAPEMDARIAEAERRTPVTVNQWPFSPLLNLEASRDSPLGIPLGAAVHLGPIWLQAGVGVTRPTPSDPRLPDTGAPPHKVPSGAFVGGQFMLNF